jgi:hypothetical protein
LCEALERLRVPITRFSDLLAEFREFERASTCVDAVVEQVIHCYLSSPTSAGGYPTDDRGGDLERRYMLRLGRHLRPLRRGD